MEENRTLRKIARGPLVSFLSGSSLWDGGDHLLVVEQKGYKELYRRFNYGDIQAFVICQSERRLYLGLALGVFLLIGLITLLASSGMAGKITGGVLTGIFGALIFANLMKGPTCTCRLKTSVSLVPVRSISRWKQVDRMLPELRRRIAERQGEKEPEEMVNAWTVRLEKGEVEPLSPAARGAGVRRSVSGPRENNARFDLALYSLLLVDGGLALMGFAWTHPVLMAVRVCIILAALFCAIGALVRYRNAVVAGALRGFTIAAICYLSAGAIGVYAFFVGMQTRDPGTPVSTHELFYHLAAMTPYDGMGWLSVFLGNVLISGILGTIGLLQTLNYRRGKRKKTRVPPLPADPVKP